MRVVSSAEERSPHTREVAGSNPALPIFNSHFAIITGELMLSDDITLLIELQEKDNAIDVLNSQISGIPLEITQKKELILQLKTDFEATKSLFTQLQIKRKEKEMDVETKENLIKKHSGELNSIKSNDAYKALILEIEQAKKEKYALEDEILQIMEDSEKKSAELKENEKKYKEKEKHIEQEITDITKKLDVFKNDVLQKCQQRTILAQKVEPNILSMYEYIRSGKGGVAIACIEGENCGGCHINLRPQLINEVHKAQALVRCDNCFRILYKK